MIWLAEEIGLAIGRWLDQLAKTLRHTPVWAYAFGGGLLVGMVLEHLTGYVS